MRSRLSKFPASSVDPIAAVAADALVDAATPEVERLRGYRWVSDGQREINFDEPGEYVVDDGAP